MSQVYIVCGIDTDCGKTYVTGLLAKECMQRGLSCITQKMVQTGCNSDIADDIIEHRRIMQIDILPEDKNHSTNPYVFNFPASPHVASQLQHTVIEFETIHNHIQTLAQTYSIVFSESAGGLCVPFTNTLLCTDFIKHTGYPIILVSSSKLGSINHTILSIDYCKIQNIKIHAVVFNVFPQTDNKIAESSFEFLKTYIYTHLPHTQFVKQSQLDLLVL